MVTINLTKSIDNKIYLKNGLEKILDTKKIYAIANDKGVFLFSKKTTPEIAIKSLSIIRKELKLIQNDKPTL